MKTPALHWQILISLILAVTVGLLFPDKNYISPEVNPVLPYITWMGVVFLRLLKMLIIPLIFFSIINGVTNIGSAAGLGKMGAKVFLFYISTSVLAILTGLILVNIIKPGIGTETDILNTTEDLAFQVVPLSETLLNMIPDNIIAAMANGNLVSIILFALLFGFFITRLNEPAKSKMANTFEVLFEVMMKMTSFVIKLTPIGIFGIVAGIVAAQSDILEVGRTMGLYMLTVAAGLLFHMLVVLPLIVKIVAKENPYKHFRNMGDVLLTAFSTSSSSATLPLTMDAVNTRSGVSKKVSNFTLPLGATINMDGTALYECVAALFIAQAYGVELGIAEQATVVITALLASVGAAGIPMAGLVMISIVLSAVGLPLEGVGLIIAVDRLLDMLRTTVNVWSDSCGAVVIAKSEKESLNL